MRETPENKLPSREEIKGQVEKIYDLMGAEYNALRAVDLLVFNNYLTGNRSL